MIDWNAISPDGFEKLCAELLLTPDVRDWLKVIGEQYPFDILTWEERDLAREIAKHRAHLSAPPPIVPRSAEPVGFYTMHPYDRVFRCNEFEDVGFHVTNPESISEDVQRVQEFIEFIRHNEVTFYDEEGEDEAED